jgi:hypothetical protein
MFCEESVVVGELGMRLSVAITTTAIQIKPTHSLHKSSSRDKQKHAVRRKKKNLTAPEAKIM